MIFLCHICAGYKSSIFCSKLDLLRWMKGVDLMERSLDLVLEAFYWSSTSLLAIWPYSSTWLLWVQFKQLKQNLNTQCYFWLSNHKQVSQRHSYKQTNGLKIQSVLQKPKHESWMGFIRRREDLFLSKVPFCIFNFIPSGLHLPRNTIPGTK